MIYIYRRNFCLFIIVIDYRSLEVVKLLLKTCNQNTNYDNSNLAIIRGVCREILEE